jgi:hypothetical protein
MKVMTPKAQIRRTGIDLIIADRKGSLTSGDRLFWTRGRPKFLMMFEFYAADNIEDRLYFADGEHRGWQYRRPGAAQLRHDPISYP